MDCNCRSEHALINNNSSPGKTRLENTLCLDMLSAGGRASIGQQYKTPRCLIIDSCPALFLAQLRAQAWRHRPTSGIRPITTAHAERRQQSYNVEPARTTFLRGPWHLLKCHQDSNSGSSFPIKTRRWLATSRFGRRELCGSQETRKKKGTESALLGRGSETQPAPTNRSEPLAGCKTTKM